MEKLQKLSWKRIIALLMLLSLVGWVANSYARDENIGWNGVSYEIDGRKVFKITQISKGLNKDTSYYKGDTLVKEQLRKSYFIPEVIDELKGDSTLFVYVSYKAYQQSLDGTEVLITSVYPHEDSIVEKYFPIPRMEYYQDVVYVQKGRVFSEREFVYEIRWGLLGWTVGILMLSIFSVIGMLKDPRVKRKSIILFILAINIIFAAMMTFFHGYTKVAVDNFIYGGYVFLPLLFLSVFGFRRREKIHAFLKKETGKYHQIENSEFKKLDYIIYRDGTFYSTIVDVRDLSNLNVIIGGKEKVNIIRSSENECIDVAIPNKEHKTLYGLFNKRTGILIYPKYYYLIKVLENGRYLVQIEAFSTISKADLNAYCWAYLESDGKRIDPNIYSYYEKLKT